MSNENYDGEEAGSASGSSVHEARREALKRLGIMGAYTAPAMLMLLHTKAAAQLTDSGCTGPDGCDAV